ncbi:MULTISPECIES: hypothetical protein [Actinomadura]|uniref:Uncharacterized protein n=2 Tax=Actinomadura TaxID=1988 RepID=A0A7D3VXK8_ACTVE|nr:MULTISPECIES: hypothetical protein [Actinomadura]MBO2458955.1 hypothetical protein [Actinomadura violacea]QKG25780.1 hypothetical protein ACTIVE_7432 [Actinomadura verrucosospora]
MFLALVVGGILVYAAVDVVRTALRRRRARREALARPRLRTEPEPLTAAELERLAADEPEALMWTEDDQRWLESRRISLRS